jgi:hypothetical protein
MTTNKPEQNVAGPEYQPTAQEMSVIGKHFSGKTAPTAPRMKVLEGGKCYLPDHPDKAFGYALIMEAAGTTDFDFIQGLVEQLANASSQRDQLNEGDLNFMLAVVKEVKPRDQIEAMLAAQMAAVHMATMKFARRLANVETIQEQDSAERAFNKLVRTFCVYSYQLINKKGAI